MMMIQRDMIVMPSLAPCFLFFLSQQENVLKVNKWWKKKDCVLAVFLAVMRFLLGDMYHSSGFDAICCIFSELENWFLLMQQHHHLCVFYSVYVYSFGVREREIEIQSRWSIFNLVKIFIVRGDVSIKNLQMLMEWCISLPNLAWCQSSCFLKKPFVIFNFQTRTTHREFIICIYDYCHLQETVFGDIQTEN